jgi:hypothetical protein
VSNINMEGDGAKMGKQARMSSRAAAAERVRQAQRQSRHRPAWIIGIFILLGVAVAVAIIETSGNGSGVSLQAPRPTLKRITVTCQAPSITTSLRRWEARTTLCG